MWYVLHVNNCLVLYFISFCIYFKPIQLREDVPDKRQRINNLSVMLSNPKAEEIVKEAILLESGRFVARDIGKSHQKLVPK